MQVQKAIDAGHPHHHAGQRLGGGRRRFREFVAKYNERNPGKEVLYLNYAAVDPVLTNDKCNFWHFRWDANSDIKMEALTDYMKAQPEHQEDLPDQPGLLVRPGGARRRREDAQGEAARHPGRRRRAASAAEDHRLRALHREDQGVGRRQRHHRQLGAGFRAAAQGGGRRGPAGRLVHLLRGRRRRPDRRQADRPQPPRVRDHAKASPTSLTRRRRSWRRRSGPSTTRHLFYPRAFNQMRMLAAAINKAKSADPRRSPRRSKT